MGTSGNQHASRPRAGQLRSAGVLAVASIVLVVSCSGSGSDADGTTLTTPGAAASSTSTTTLPEPVPEAARSFSGASGVVIAHRGASGAAPEHTFAAYDLAQTEGATYLEEDLQLTADGVVVVLHDTTLDRTVRGPADRCTGPVAEQTLAQLQDCDAGTWFNERNPELANQAFVGEPIPTLAEVFDRYGVEARHYIEIKSPNEQPGLTEALLALLDETEFAAGDGLLPPVVIQSFIGDTLRGIHEQRPALPLVQLVATGVVPDAATLDRIADYAVAIAPNKADVTAELIAAANARCLDVHPWTVDDEGLMGQLLVDGAGGMFTNQPGRLIDVAQGQPERVDLCDRAGSGAGS